MITQLHSAVLDRILAFATGGSISQEELELLLSRCMTLLPDDEESAASEAEMLRDDATAALVYGLRTAVNGEAREAAWAARRAYDAADRRALSDSGVSLEEADAEAKLLRHPAIQDELANQSQDLHDLEEFARKPSTATQTAVWALIERAREEGDRLGKRVRGEALGPRDRP